MSEREYLLYYSDTARKRHYHKTQKGQVNQFMVQLEVKVENQWKTVVRYDCAHDFSHRDRYNWKGEQLKEYLNLPYAEALTIADEDIDDNWEIYMFEFLKGMYP